ncbi:MAG: hypothetical protein EOO90_09055 [Pedobacter sp.]|nr:MAG: hypothetical protein EOO90_09055 [Pedobacter sp.]
MKLTDGEKLEIRAHISVVRFRETFNELYDHIVNSFESNDVAFSIAEVDRIVKTDFNGFGEIVEQEDIFQKQLNKGYNKRFWQEMLSTFRWPQLGGNALILALCILIYHNTESFSSLKPMLNAVVILVYIIALFGFLQIIRNNYKHLKGSIRDNYFAYACSFGVLLVNPGMHALNKNNSFGISDDTRLLILLSIFFFTSIYVRVFFKFYSQKVKVLPS